MPAAPSGTSVRFGALAAVAVAGTLVAYAKFATLWPTDGVRREEACQVRVGMYFTDTLAVDPDEATWAAYRACLASVWQARLGWLVGGMLALALAAALLYRLQPVWRIRRSRLRRLDEFPSVSAFLTGPLTELIAVAGLRHPPVFLLDPASPRAGGLAFGRRHPTYVCLDAGIVAAAVRDRPTFDAVVLHELAHVRAGDVPVTYLTIAVWRAFLLVALLPFVAVTFHPALLSANPWRMPDAESVTATSVSMMGHAVVMVAMVFLARVAVLRAREKHADVLVADWTGRHQPYTSVIATPPARRWRRWTTHPSNAARSRAMRRPYLLLRPGVGEYFALGLAVDLAWLETVEALRLLYWYHGDNASFLVMRVVWGLSAGLLICGLVLQGVAFRRAAAGARSGVFVLPGFALGSGLALGALLHAPVGVTPLAGLGDPVPLVFAAGVAVCCAALSGWAGRCTELAGPAVAGWRTGAVAAVTLLTCVVVIAPLYRYPHAASTAVWQSLVSPALDLVREYATVAGDPTLATPSLWAVVVPFLYNPGYRAVGVCLAALWVLPVLLVPGLGRRLRAGLLGSAVATAVWVPLIVFPGADDDPATALVMSARELTGAAILQLVIAVVLTRRSGWLAASVGVWAFAAICTAGIWLAHGNDGVVDSVLAARPMQFLPLTATAALLIGAAVPRPAGPQPTAAVAWGGRAGSGQPVLALAALLTIVGATLVYSPKAPGAVPILPPATAPARINPDQALVIWSNGGGLQQLNAITAANAEIFSGPATPEHYAAACRRFQPVVADAAAFPSPPVEPVRSQWQAMLKSWQTAASECVRIFGEQGTGSDLLGRSFQEAPSLTTTILGELDAAAARVTGGR
ncbi:M48 family metalloprotease [Actinoplanes subglobosus]|uniref:M48 family metalloprotease n=1 Tax=Actinoplanes subglobosus TaxID=1547892 RepID=A0ABV8II41_9ACTN